MKLNAKESKELWDRVDQLLWEVWDPIGVNDSGCDDEYRGYVPWIYQLLTGGADKEKIAKALLHHANVNMGMNTDLDFHFNTAEHLIELRDRYNH